MNIHISAHIGASSATDLALVPVSMAGKSARFVPIAAIVWESAALPGRRILTPVADAATSSGAILGNVLAPLISEELRTTNSASNFYLRVAGVTLTFCGAILGSFLPAFLDGKRLAALDASHFNRVVIVWGFALQRFMVASLGAILALTSRIGNELNLANRAIPNPVFYGVILAALPATEFSFGIVIGLIFFAAVFASVCLECTHKKTSYRLPVDTLVEGVQLPIGGMYNYSTAYHNRQRYNTLDNRIIAQVT